MSSGTTTRINPFAAIPTSEEALRTTQDAIQRINAVRADLALLYARLPADERGEAHPEAEFEIGEALQAVRKAYTRLLKARGVLAQDALPFTRPERSRDL